MNPCFCRRAALVITAGLCATAISLLGGCAAAERPGGRLVIVGGGLADSNETVWRSFVDGLDSESRVSVLPTASGVPERSGPGSVGDIARYAPVGCEVSVVDLTQSTPERADDPAVVAAIRSSDALWFTGGVQSRITSVFRPAGVDTRAYEAAAQALASGGTIGGTSAGAAMMSDPMIRSGNPARAFSGGAAMVSEEADDDEDENGGDPAGPAIRLGQGMGFFPYGITDQHFIERGRLPRLIVALETTGEMYGFGVSEDRGFQVDLGTDTIRSLGSNALLLVDMNRASRSRDERRNIRVSLFGDGDTARAEDGWRLGPRAHRLRIEPADRARPAMQNHEDRLRVLDALRPIASGETASVAATASGWRYTFSADSRTRIWRAPEGDADDFAVEGVRLDVEPIGP